MEKTQITKCPKCDSTFRVTPAQLNIAKGAVRCGACLHVFRASDYFQGPKQESSPQDDRTQDMFSESLFETPAHKSTLIDDDNDYDVDDDDGLIHDDMPDEDGFIDNDKSDSFTIEMNEDFLSINPSKQVDPFFSDSDKLIDSVPTEGKDDESWAQALLDDSDDDDHQQQLKTQQQAQQKVLPKISQQAFSYIEVDPLDLSLPQQRSKTKFWLATTACLLMLITLSAQLAFFNFDQWSRQESMRPWYKLACEQLECTLPSAYDLSKIRTTASPQVSSHSKFQDALTVDVLFMNHATYQQAFPRLELTFTDLNDKPIAHRLFTPNEYLAGEAAGLSLMPVQTPIHIALEIRDPGPNANNYRVRFLAP